MFKVKASMIHLQCIIFSETCYGKNAEAAENGHIFHFVNVLQRSVIHFRIAQTAHQAVTIMA
jgi:hypothetical protein